MNLKIYEKTKYNNIYKHRFNGTYAVDLSLGYNNAGKRIRTTKTGIKTEKEARSILNNEEKKKNIKRNLTVISNFEDGIEEYYEYCLKFETLKVSSMKNKKMRFKNNIIPFFEGKKISKITDKDIINFKDFLTEKGYSTETKKTIIRQLKAYFNYLVNYKQILNSNPCLRIKNFKEEKINIEYCTLEEINCVFNAIENDKVKSEEIKALMISIIKILFFEGLRIGELMGIKFKDFEFDILNKNITNEKEIALNLNRTVYYTIGGWSLSNGKTKDSLGRIFIGSNVVNYLIKYIRLVQKNGIVFNKNDYVFTNPKTGKIYSQEGLRDYLNYFFDLANIERRTFHQLRHSCGTFMLSIGYSLEDVKDKLRHSSIRTTEKYYATFYESVKRKRASEIDKYA